MFTSKSTHSATTIHIKYIIYILVNIVAYIPTKFENAHKSVVYCSKWWYFHGKKACSFHINNVKIRIWYEINIFFSAENVHILNCTIPTHDPKLSIMQSPKTNSKENHLIKNFNLTYLFYTKNIKWKPKNDKKKFYKSKFYTHTYYYK